MQSLVYPSKILNLTQNYNMGSHIPASHGTPCSFPIDEACEDGSRSWFYAPCDIVIKRKYGVGNKGTNTIWLQSINKVKLANGKETYITIMVMHPEDDDLKKLKVGQTFKQYSKIFREGMDGHATGPHFHMEISYCEFSKLSNHGWIQNNRKEWIMSPGGMKPEDAYFVDKKFTKIKNTKGLKFKELSTSSSSTKQILYLPKNVEKWRVYKLNVKPVVGNECGFLKPKKFGGLEYDIIKWISDNVCVIKTRDYGEVQIYVAKETGAIIK